MKKFIFLVVLFMATLTMVANNVATHKQSINTEISVVQSYDLSVLNMAQLPVYNLANQNKIVVHKNYNSTPTNRFTVLFEEADREFTKMCSNTAIDNRYKYRNRLQLRAKDIRNNFCKKTISKNFRYKIKRDLRDINGIWGIPRGKYNQ